MIKGIFDFLDGSLSIHSSGHPDYRNNSPKRKKKFQLLVNVAGRSCPCKRLPSFYRYSFGIRLVGEPLFGRFALLSRNPAK